MSLNGYVSYDILPLKKNYDPHEFISVSRDIVYYIGRGSNPNILLFHI